jgi:hypothetical protein
VSDAQRRGGCSFHFLLFSGCPFVIRNYSTQELKWHRLKLVVFNTTITVSQRRSICDPECPNSSKPFCHRQQSCKLLRRSCTSARSKGFAVNLKMSTANQKKASSASIWDLTTPTPALENVMSMA